MFKNLCYLWLTVLSCSFAAGAQNIVPKYLDLEESIPDIKVDLLVGTELSPKPLSSDLGKVIILEFWATFCGPCLPAMDHLARLQQQFPDDLVVYAITEEPIKTVQRFLNKRPTSLNIAIDQSGYLNQLFYHQFMPHTVLIGPDGIIKAITSPEKITAESIHIAKSGANPNIELKAEFKPKSVNSDALGYVNFTEGNILKINVSPAKEMIQTQVRKPSEQEYQFVNCSIPMIYTYLNNSLQTNKRPKDCLELAPENKALLNQENIYCFEIKVPKHLQSDLESIAIEHLEKVFQIRPVIENRTRQRLVFVEKKERYDKEISKSLKKFSPKEVATFLWEQKLIPFKIDLTGTEKSFSGEIPTQVPDLEPFLHRNGYTLEERLIDKSCLILHNSAHIRKLDQ